MPSLYDGPTPTTWQENPRFAQMRADGVPFTAGNHSGVLPELEARVPIVADRLIHQPSDEIGEYGGTWRLANSGWHIDLASFNPAGVVRTGADGVSYTPFVMKETEFSDDGRVLTFTLRQGLKFSDGTPLDIESVKLAHEGINFNPEMWAGVQMRCQNPISGTWCDFEAIDDLHWSLTYDGPMFWILEGERAHTYHQYCRIYCAYASEYHKQFIPGYGNAQEIQAMMDELDVDTWVANYKARISVHGYFGKNVPEVGFLIQTGGLSTGATQVTTANPYFFGFDPEGNQLPYVDGSFSVGFESREVAVFRAMAGESDAHTQIYRTDELPLYQERMALGDYSIYPWPDTGGTDLWLSHNQTFNEDPEIGRMMREEDFRIALSLAMNREEINDVVFLGLGVPSNAIPHFTTPYYPGDQWRDLDIERNLSRANTMLDTLGYRDSDGDGIRNRKGDLTGDSGNIEMFIEVDEDRFVTGAQLLVADLADIGIRLDFALNGEASEHVFRDNTLYFSMGGGRGTANPFHRHDRFLHPARPFSLTGSLMGAYLESGGTEGMSPTGPDPAWQPLAPEGTFPADSTGKVTQMETILDDGFGYPLAHPTRVAAGKEYYELTAETKFTTGMVSFAPAFRGIQLNRNNFRNVQKHHFTAANGAYGYLYYFEDGTDNMNHPGNKSKRYESQSFLTGLTYD